MGLFYQAMTRKGTHTMPTTKKEKPVSTPAVQTLSFADRMAIATAKGWRPEPGDILIGTLVGMRKGGVGGEYGEYPVLVYKNHADGTYIAVHAFHTMLKDWIKANKDAMIPGTPHTIAYNGRTERVDDKGKDQSYENYYAEVGEGIETELTTAVTIDEIPF